jgi:alanyl-tRNA synthetase
MTERLYFDDPFERSFEATVVAHRDQDGRRTVELDRTLFYPESGGQMADHGTLEHEGGTTAVRDVQLAGDNVLHVVDGDLPPVGAEVRGTIDGERRRVHMALHTGQHILSRALADEAQAETLSSRLGETACTIDVDRDRLDDSVLARALNLANAVVEDDLRVDAIFPNEDELAQLSLRREAKVDGPVRVVKVGDFDVTPCGGTHCTRSGQVGLIDITGMERRKRRLRLSFVAGRRARLQLGREARAIRELGRTLSCAPEEVATAYDKLREQAREAQDARKAAESMLAEHIAERLLAGRIDDDPIIASLEPHSTEVVREIAKRIAAQPRAVALLALRSDAGLHAILARGPDSSFDCGAFMKRATATAGGGGGGRPDRAEGRLPTKTDWRRLVAELLGS